MFRGAAFIEELDDLPVTATLIEGWGDGGTTVEWRGRAIHGQVGWKGGLVGDAQWDALLAERSRLTLRFPSGSTRRFVIAYVSSEDGTIDVWGEGALPETTELA